ncbi:MAG: DUF6898 family protein [Devosia sp.]
MKRRALLYLRSTESCYHAAMGQGEVFFEFSQVGRQMRVAAIDADTGTEVIVITPVSATKAQMQQLALGKLRKKLGERAAPVAVPGKFA